MSKGTQNLTNNNNGRGLNPQFDNILTSENLIKHVQDLVISNSDALPFPIEVFPEKVKNIIEATKECLEFPVDFTGASMLYATSVAIGNTLKIKVTETWISNAVVYIAIIGRPGVNKSHPLTFALQPIMKHDNLAFAEYENQKSIFDKVMGLSKNERRQESENLVKPVLKKYIVSDTTLEALINVHKFNKRGLGVYVDELAGWFKNFNRYNKGSEQEFWLSNWSGKPVIIDRKTDDPVRITNPFISVCGTIQTSILDEMAKDKRGLNGFIDRFLPVIPTGLKTPKWTKNDLDPKHIEDWERVISNLLAIQPEIKNDGIPNGQVLDFNPKAKDLLRKWQAENANLCNETENENLTGIYVKLEIYCIRLSLILQALYFACGDENISHIGEKAVNGAIKLVEYFRNAAKRVHFILSESSPLDHIPLNKQRFYDSLPETFETNEAIIKSEPFEMSTRTVKRFLSDTKLFRRIKQGNYEKIL
jgi:hypothetical protein